MSAPADSVQYYPVGRSINDIIADLAKPLPDSLLKTRRQGQNDLTYIPWHNATRVLDRYAPGWSYHVEVQHVAGKVVCIATITISAEEGPVIRQATGYEDDTCGGYGDPFSNAESMALRRAAAKFGVGRYLYNK